MKDNEAPELFQVLSSPLCKLKNPELSHCNNVILFRYNYIILYFGGFYYNFEANQGNIDYWNDYTQM